MTWQMKWMPAYSYGGPFTPIGIVIHCTESSNNPGSAEANAGPGWFGGPAAGTSAHKIVDQDSIVEGVKRDHIAWHVGPGGNGLYLGYEFCGRASWSADYWLAPEQVSMIKGAAPFIADDLKAMGAPARWLSLTQVAQKQKGLLTHNDVRLALGGTTHSDPGPNFPYALLLQEVNKYMVPGGEEDIMATKEELQQIVHDELNNSQYVDSIANRTRVILRDSDKTYGLRAIVGLLNRIATKLGA